MTTVDAHQHFWELGRFDYSWLDSPELEPIRRTYLPEDLRSHLSATGVDRSVFVQTQHNVAENRWALQMAQENEFLAGVVGWVDLASPECEQQLLEFKDHPKFVGVRHVTQDEPDDSFIVRDDVIQGLRVLQKHQVPFDLLFYVKHLQHVPVLGRALPDLPMVIDHLAKPKIKHQCMEPWGDNFRAAAQFPRVYCKISGMVTEADWSGWKADDLWPYVEIALDAFGPERCMFGSDWPVCELAGSYEQVHGVARELLGSLSESEQAAIFGGTATKFYRLAAG